MTLNNGEKEKTLERITGGTAIDAHPAKYSSEVFQDYLESSFNGQGHANLDQEQIMVWSRAIKNHLSWSTPNWGETRFRGSQPITTYELTDDRIVHLFAFQRDPMDMGDIVCIGLHLSEEDSIDEFSHPPLLAMYGYGGPGIVVSPLLNPDLGDDASWVTTVETFILDLEKPA